MTNVVKASGFDMNPPEGIVPEGYDLHCDAAILANRFGMQIELVSTNAGKVYKISLGNQQWDMKELPEVDTLTTMLAEGFTREMCTACNKYQDECTGSCHVYHEARNTNEKLIRAIWEDKTV